MALAPEAFLGGAMSDEHFRRLLKWFDLSWAGYYRVRKGVKKRIARHMLQFECRNMDDYLEMLAMAPALKRECQMLLTVSISRFFRDRSVWQILETQVMPTVLASRPARVKVWSAGCACGEEVYSFKILWDILESRSERLPELELWATDVNLEVLERGKKGIYPASSLKETPDSVRIQYFVFQRENRSFVVLDRLKQSIRWKQHDLLRDAPPRTDFDIIFLRNNLLTYYEPAVCAGPFRSIVQCLAPRGFLIVGAKESVATSLPGSIAPSQQHPQIFQRVVS